MNSNQATLNDILGKDGLFDDGDWVESKDQDPNGDVRLIQLADIGDGEYINKSSRFLTSEKVKELKCTLLKEGDLLISRMPDPIGRACIFPSGQGPCVTVVDVSVVRPDKNLVDINWLKYCINSPSFRSNIFQYVSGTTRQRISRGNLSKIEFVVPSLSEQRRIATILDKADSLRCKRAETIKLLDQFLRSVFLEMFGDPVRNEKGLKQKPLKELIELKSGEFLPAKSMDKSGKHPVYGGNGVNGTHSKYMFEKPTVVIGRVGAYCGVIHLTKPNSWVTDNALFVAKMDLSISLRYLEWALRIADLNKYSGQSGQPLISGNRIYPIKITVPDIEQQIKFNEIVGTHEATLLRYESTKGVGENLFNSLTQCAFRGEL